MASNLEIVSSCPVCFISYNGEDNKPLVLPCGHPVCSSCLNTLQERNDKKCPVCKTSWEEHDVSKFIMCYPLIMDECALMKCLAHDFEILFWCTQCFKMICKKCVTNSHSNCHLKVVEDAGDDMKSYLVSISSNLNAKLSRMESELSREMDSNYKCRVDAHLVHTFSEQMMIMLNKRKEDLEMTQSMLQSTKGYSQNALNEVFDDGYNSSTRQLLKLQEIFNHLECSNDISVPKKDDSMGPILDVIPKLKVRMFTRLCIAHHIVFYWQNMCQRVSDTDILQSNS